MMHCHIVETSFDDYSYCAGNVQIIYSTVGKFCSIANSVRINPGNHPQWRVTQHHMTYRRVAFGFDETDDTAFFDWRRAHKCTIGHDVWIGHGAIVMPGVEIGHGAIIGSGAVVTKNIPPYAIAVGVPAKVIKYRFDEKTIEALLSIEWWNWDRAQLEKNFKDLNDVPTFIESGVKDFVIDDWVGLLAPAKTPKPIIAKLNQALNEILNSPEGKARLLSMGIFPSPGTPDKFGEQIKGDLIRFAPIVKTALIKTE
jgi:phosphonate metabolism protein (transferase hexapeptide repeat family)